MPLSWHFTCKLSYHFFPLASIKLYLDLTAAERACTAGRLTCHRSCLDSLKKYVWSSRSFLSVLLVVSLLPLEQLQGKRWTVQTIFSPNYMSYMPRSGFNPDGKILLHSQFCCPLRCYKLSLLIMRAKSKGDTRRPFMWRMLGYTLKDIRLGFGERSHLNKQANWTAHQASASPQLQPSKGRARCHSTSSHAAPLPADVFPITWAHINPPLCRL